MKVFCFYGHDPEKVGIKACLSQWYMCDFTVDGHLYHCMEQYMMAQKAIVFKDYDMLREILSTGDPKTCKAFGRKVKNFSPAKWDAVKRDIVFKGNLAKFSQNQDLKDYLLSLGDVVLAEASPFDKIWGIGMRASVKAEDPQNWKGENLLGYALTKVKETLEKKEEM